MVDYTKQEERAAVRKVDFFVLPFIMLCFVMMQFDRTNLGNAQTDNFSTTVGMTLADVNLGQTLFSLAMVLLELPSNILAKRFGPERWIPVIMVIWGLVTLCQAFIVNRAGFLATRFLLAAGEAGFIPGMAWYLTRWYTTGELSLRFAIFWSSNNVAGMCSGPLAQGIMSGLAGKGGWHGWQYLFAIEGVMTLVVAAVAFIYLPSAPMFGGKSMLIPVISAREAEILAHRVLEDDPRKEFTRGDTIKLADIKDTFTDWRLIGHCAAGLLSSVMITPINTYGPSVIRSLGYAGYTANGMQAPGAAIALVWSVGLAWNSDRVRDRGLHIATAMSLACAGCLWLALAPDQVGRNVLYGGYLMAAGTMGTGQGINASWLSSRFEERRRPVALVAYVMSIQLAGFAGANVFKPGDAPRYTQGLIICGACCIAAATVMVVWKLLYLWDDKRSTVAEASLDEPIEQEEKKQVESDSSPAARAVLVA